MCDSSCSNMWTGCNLLVFWDEQKQDILYNVSSIQKNIAVLEMKKARNKTKIARIYLSNKQSQVLQLFFSFDLFHAIPFVSLFIMITETIAMIQTIWLVVICDNQYHIGWLRTYFRFVYNTNTCFQRGNRKHHLLSMWVD